MEEYINITESKNKEITNRLIKDWGLGPVKATTLRTANRLFWSKKANKWYVSEAEARRMLCANCEHSADNPSDIRAMESVRRGKLDVDGGGRVWCKKFDFICHNLRTCDAWDSREEEE